MYPITGSVLVLIDMLSTKIFLSSFLSSRSVQLQTLNITKDMPFIFFELSTVVVEKRPGHSILPCSGFIDLTGVVAGQPIAEKELRIDFAGHRDSHRPLRGL
jgi:hypothetical protein